MSMALRCCALLFVILARTEFSYGLLCTIPMTPIMSDHNKRARAAFTHEVTHATRPLALIRIVIRLGYTYLLPSCIVDINSRHQERKSRCKKPFKILAERQDLHPSISLSTRLKCLIATLSAVPSAPKERFGGDTCRCVKLQKTETTIRSTKSVYRIG